MSRAATTSAWMAVAVGTPVTPKCLLEMMLVITLGLSPGSRYCPRTNCPRGPTAKSEHYRNESEHYRNALRSQKP